jgi:hypothetical protein
VCVGEGGGLGWCMSVAGGIPLSPCPGTWRTSARVYTLFDAADCIMVDARGSLEGGGHAAGQGGGGGGGGGESTDVQAVRLSKLHYGGCG